MKPLDFGGGGVSGSVNADGRMIALNFYHPQHGYVTLTSAAPFLESERYNPAAVRAYRRSLAEQDGFGLRFDVPINGRSFALLAWAIPTITLLPSSGGSIELSTFADAKGAVQRISDSAYGTLQRMRAKGEMLHWGSKLCLQRCAYTQITEGGPLPMPPLRMHFFAQDELLVIENPTLGAAVAIAGLDVSGFAECNSDMPLELDFPLTGERLTYGIGISVEDAIMNARWLADQASYRDAETEWFAVTSLLPTNSLVRRGIVYALMNAIPVGDGICLLTDHMLLPLSWNRDAYYAARALLSAGQMETVRRHLLWTFETSERPNGEWARCYLANGRVKDGAFQLDQQLYPLLELADYLIATHDELTAARLLPQVEAVLAMLDARRTQDALLFPTDETPADDPIPLPYHLSSHILLWHTLKRLDSLGLARRWVARLPELRATIQQTFISDYNGERIYAYAADGEGHFHFYHDANDLPLALAPAWGFTDAADPVWRSTINFAFSDANRGGFYDGHLGSVHSPAPWALGDIQDLIIARALGDSDRVECARAALRHAAQFDGSLPEAYNAGDGSVYSRDWFVWTNAALACVELGAFE